MYLVHHGGCSPTHSLTHMRLYDLDLPALRSLLLDHGEPTYRAEQLWEWLYGHLATSFDQMTNLPLLLRQILAAKTTIGVADVVNELHSPDGRARKDLLRLGDGEMVEAVLMRYQRRRTVCVSTQIGCAVGCGFCATGQMGFRRDLTSGEITCQIVHFARVLRAEGERLTNVVLMGMGEPLLNYEASIAAVRRLNHPRGVNLGQRHFTISTAGIVPGIKRLAEEGLQSRLAISLHAATNGLRNELVPLNRRYGLDELFQACSYYTAQTGRRITIEWTLIENVNDGEEQAQALAARISGLPFHVNIIPLNPTAGYDGRPPSRDKTAAFAAILAGERIPNTIRVRRGAAIQAGCGQLRQRHQNKIGVSDRVEEHEKPIDQ